MRLFLACCLFLFSGTAGFAEKTVKTFVEECGDWSFKGFESREMGECVGVITTMMILGPFLIQKMRFCPGEPTPPPIVGFGAMNKYVRAHPNVLNSDGQYYNDDRLIMLTLAFREEWPCK